MISSALVHCQHTCIHIFVSRKILNLIGMDTGNLEMVREQKLVECAVYRINDHWIGHWLLSCIFKRSHFFSFVKFQNYFNTLKM